MGPVQWLGQPQRREDSSVANVGWNEWIMTQQAWREGLVLTTAACPTLLACFWREGGTEQSPDASALRMLSSESRVWPQQLRRLATTYNCWLCRRKPKGRGGSGKQSSNCAPTSLGFPFGTSTTRT